eukprot:SAG11_NODE_2699_length_3077_cov_2.064473_5_plen_47_part_00
MEAFRRLSRQRQHGQRAEQLVEFICDHADAVVMMYQALLERGCAMQ